MFDNHHFWWRFFPKGELTQIYISVALRFFAVSLMSLFVPLYLYQEMGFSFSETISFYIFYAIIFAVATPFAGKFSAKYGLKHSVLASVPFYLLFIIFLYFLPSFNFSLVLLSSLLGISLAFYWMGMHLLFYHASDHEHRGEEVGKRASISLLATVLGPLIGGFLIHFVGFKIVFGLTSVFLLLSALILFLSKEDHIRYHFSLRSLVNKSNWKDSLFFVSQGTRVIAEGVIWPLLIFFILGNYFSLGIVGSLLGGVASVLVLLSGKYSDHVDKRKIIRYVTGFSSLFWFLRAFVTTTGQVFGITILGAITYGIKESPLAALEYDKAKGDITGYFVSREIFICLGRILLLTFVLMINSLSGGLVLQAFVNLATLLF